jgi:hypothetical protein
MAFYVLNADEIAELDRPVTGKGGFENFLRRLQRQFRCGTSEIRLTDKDLEDIPYYAFHFKHGGWQRRLLKIFGRVLGPTLDRQE